MDVSGRQIRGAGWLLRRQDEREDMEDMELMRARRAEEPGPHPDF